MRIGLLLLFCYLLIVFCFNVISLNQQFLLYCCFTIIEHVQISLERFYLPISIRNLTYLWNVKEQQIRKTQGVRSLTFN